MPYNINLDEFAIKLGISSDKLNKDIATYSAITEVFPLLDVSGCKAGLFGGTALNKIYFGKKQRLSYDLDIFIYSYKKTIDALIRNGAELKYSGIMPKNPKIASTRMSFQNIILDLVDAKGVLEDPKKVQITDILYYYNQLIPPVVVPSYSLEYLLAEKTIAMGDRNELKDVYDTWTGIKLLKDINKYYKYTKKLARDRGIKDIVAYLDFHIANMLLNIDYYAKKQIEVLDQPNTQIMLREIKAFIDKL